MVKKDNFYTKGECAAEHKKDGLMNKRTAKIRRDCAFDVNTFN